MMYDHEKSDPAIVAVKPTNKAGQPAAELVEPRAGAEGVVSQQSPNWARTDLCGGREVTASLPRTSCRKAATSVFDTPLPTFGEFNKICIA